MLTDKKKNSFYRKLAAPIKKIIVSALQKLIRDITGERTKKGHPQRFKMTSSLSEDVTYIKLGETTMFVMLQTALRIFLFVKLSFHSFNKKNKS